MIKALLLKYIKSHYLYYHINNLKELSEKDKNIFKKNLKREIRKYGVEEINRQIENSIKINA